MTKIINIAHIYQPTGNACGPTCLKMIVDYFYSGINISVELISNMCGTDWEVGTPPDRMEIGMNTLNLKYVEYLKSPRPYELLKKVIDDNNIPVLRTITKGVPHWIIINGYFLVYEDNQKSILVFNVLDPWLGSITYTEFDLERIWKQREYQFFEVIKRPFVDIETGQFNLPYELVNLDPKDFFP